MPPKRWGQERLDAQLDQAMINDDIDTVKHTLASGAIYSLHLLADCSCKVAAVICMDQTSRLHPSTFFIICIVNLGLALELQQLVGPVACSSVTHEIVDVLLHLYNIRISACYGGNDVDSAILARFMEHNRAAVHSVSMDDSLRRDIALLPEAPISIHTKSAAGRFS